MVSNTEMKHYTNILYIMERVFKICIHVFCTVVGVDMWIFSDLECINPNLEMEGMKGCLKKYTNVQGIITTKQLKCYKKTLIPCNNFSKSLQRTVNFMLFATPE